ncbi:MAG: hypothetical protein JWP31_1990 [Aeromicrobium sp.]|nr:hypothetical protein [Aeromicrobium sp.]
MNTPVTREAATTRARELLGADAEPCAHAELDGDPAAGGYAFRAGTSFAIIGFHGGYVTSLLGFGDRTVDNVVAEWLDEERQRSRPRWRFGPSQDLALEAVDAATSVAEIAGDAPPEVVDHAEYVAIVLRRVVANGGDAVRELSETPHLLTPPSPGRRYTHPCPLDGTPTIHQDRYPRAVCSACQSRAADSSGRPVAGYNDVASGGLMVFYADSPTGAPTDLADEVMASGRCWIGGVPCLMTEARFGGVVVQTLD